MEFFFCVFLGGKKSSSHFVQELEERYARSVTLSLSLSLRALCPHKRAFSSSSRVVFSSVSLRTRERRWLRRRAKVASWRGASFFRSSRCLGLSNLSLDEEKRPPKGSVGGRREMSRTARGRAHATVETRERGRRRVDGCVGDDENRSPSVFASRREEKRRDTRRAMICVSFVLGFPWMGTF